jgi:hypothetical protein
VDSTFSKEKILINGNSKIAIPTFISTDSEINTLTSYKFISSIDSSVGNYIIKPYKVDSILKNNGIYSLPNKLPEDLIDRIGELMNAKYFLVGYVLKWNEPELGQDGIVRHKLDVYNLNTNELIWSITNQVFISVPESDENIYFINSIESAYKKLVSKTLNEISLQSNIKQGK